MRRRRTPHTGEFEDRQEVPAIEDVGLGDLTDDISFERGELDIPAGQKIPVGVPGAPGGEVGATFPPDVAYQQKVRAAADDPTQSEKGTMSQGSEVTSTYDARPINARDFIFGDEFNVPAGA